MSQIDRELIPCFCLQVNEQQFVQLSGTIGKVYDVPCKNVLIDKELYWFMPVKDEGIFSAFSPILAVGVDAAKPTFDSILVQRVRDKLTNYDWWFAVNTADDFKNSCNTCCGDGAVPMPFLTGFNPVIAPCQTLCDLNADGDYFAIFGIPALGAGLNYYATGSFNNEALPSSGTSFANLAALLVFLNSSWTNVGSPNVEFVWTATGDGLTLIATGGNSLDSLCVFVYSIAPSP